MKIIPKLSLVLLTFLLLSNCHKNPVENGEFDVHSQDKVVSDRTENGETVVSVLGPASNYNLSEADLCSPSTVQVICVQHTCESLKSDPVDFWTLQIYYHTISAGMLVIKGVSISSISSSPYGVYTLSDPIVKSSALALSGNSNVINAEAQDGVFPNINFAHTNMYFYFDSNPSDGVKTMHKVVCNASLPNSCTYSKQQPPNAVKTLVIANNCSNSSTGSQSLTPSQEYYPCTNSNGGGGGGDQ